MASARVRAAFISLKRFDLHRARELLVRGRADPREVICLYPRLLPASSNFTRSVRALNDIADINQIAKHDAQKLSALDTFFVDYLEYIRAAEGEHFVHRHVSTYFISILYSGRMSEIQTFKNQTRPKSGRNFAHPKCPKSDLQLHHATARRISLL